MVTVLVVPPEPVVFRAFTKSNPMLVSEPLCNLKPKNNVRVTLAAVWVSQAISKSIRYAVEAAKFTPNVDVLENGEKSVDAVVVLVVNVLVNA